MTTLSDQLDMKIEESRQKNLTPWQLLDLQRDISGIRYAIGNELANAEGRYLSEKDRCDLHLVRGKLTLQAQDKKLSGAKASDLVENETSTEVMRQSMIQAKILHSGLKNRMDNSRDVLVSIAQRIKRLENEEMESRMQSHRST